MKRRKTEWVLLGLLLVVLILAGLLYNSQKKVYRDMEWGFRMLRAINNEEIFESLENYVVAEERRVFQKLEFSTSDLVGDQSDDVFIWLGGKVVPAYLATFETIPEVDQAEQFQKGIESQDAKHFEKAMPKVVQSADEAWLRAAACLNLVELNPEDELRALQLLAYLEPSLNRFLSPSQVRFFRSELERMMPKGRGIVTRSDELWHLAKELQETLHSRKGPYRTTVMNRLCLVSGAGVIYVLPADWVDQIQLNWHNIPVTSEHADQEIHNSIENYAPLRGIHFTNPIFNDAIPSPEVARARRNGLITLTAVLLVFAVLFTYTFRLMREERVFGAQRARFVATASHELRTPISVIQLHAETLALGRVSGEKRKHYEKSIVSEARRAGALVENFLTLSRQEAGAPTPRLDLEDVDLVPLVLQVIEPFGQRVSLSSDSPSELLVNGDRHALTQILFNLVDNAVKYSDDEVSVRIIPDRTGPRVEVSDTGIGIDEKDLAKVFDEFYRSEDQRVSAQRGSGIGLTLSRRLAHEMNCELMLVGNQPQGTRASLIFPRI